MQPSASGHPGQDLIELAVGRWSRFRHVVNAFGGDEGAGDGPGRVVDVNQRKVRVVRSVEGLPPLRRQPHDLIGPGVAGPVGVRQTQDHAVTTAPGVIDRQSLG
jgi:hypothetical protein